MEKPNKVKLFSELHNLLIYYSENRDQPVVAGFDFFEKMEYLCKELDLDYTEFKETFTITEGSF